MSGEFYSRNIALIREGGEPASLLDGDPPKLCLICSFVGCEILLSAL
jgi:hypothetical protein